MYQGLASQPRKRLAAALVALGTVAAGVAALVISLSVHFGPAIQSPALETVVMSQPSRPKPPPPPPTRKQEERARSSAAKGAPSARNLRNQAAQVIAPPITPLIQPPPVPTAILAGTGSAAQTGASDRLGPGQGAGGFGNGLGGGGRGSDGDGNDEAISRPEQIRGKLHFSDLPPDLRATHQGGELELAYRVGIDGRVSDCHITHSSGRPSLDRTTCDLITKRFRFRPARNARGEPVAGYIIERHGWYLDPQIDDDTEIDPTPDN